MSYLKFRFWCPSGKAFIRDYRYSGRVDELFINPQPIDLLIPQQCLGLKDKKRRWIYEGDILSLNSQAIPPSLRKLIRSNKQPIPTTIHVEVARDPTLPSNFHLEWLLPVTNGAALSVYLPLELVKQGIITGHIFSAK